MTVQKKVFADYLIRLDLDELRLMYRVLGAAESDWESLKDANGPTLQIVTEIEAIQSWKAAVDSCMPREKGGGFS